MQNNLTEVIFILDRSGSMSGLEDDVVGGFNSTIKKQKKEEGECIVSTVLFNDTSKVVHDRVSIKDIKEMELEDYQPSGCTALIDALGDSIKYIKKVHKVIRKEDVPNKTMFIITTDGQENASHKYSSNEVKKMIEQQQENDWEFIYLAANIDAVESGKALGIREDRSINYVSDKRGTIIVNECISKSIDNARANKSFCVRDFNDVKKDYAKRANKKR